MQVASLPSPAPTLVEYMPAGHATHEVMSCAPVSVLPYRPGPQLTHCDSLETPISADHRPAGHPLQSIVCVIPVRGLARELKLGNPSTSE